MGNKVIQIANFAFILVESDNDYVLEVEMGHGYATYGVAYLMTHAQKEAIQKDSDYTLQLADDIRQHPANYASQITSKRYCE